MIEDPRYGELIIEHYGWGYSEDGVSSGSNPADFHFCSDEELGFTPGPKTAIYPITETAVREVETWKKKFKCVKPEDMLIWGDYNSAKAQQLSVKFNMCEGETYCESKENIK